jgi:hypothetical protein
MHHTVNQLRSRADHQRASAIKQNENAMKMNIKNRQEPARFTASLRIGNHNPPSQQKDTDSLYHCLLALPLRPLHEKHHVNTHARTLRLCYPPPLLLHYFSSKKEKKGISESKNALEAKKGKRKRKNHRTPSLDFAPQHPFMSHT